MYDIPGLSEWEASVPDVVAQDPNWRLRVYRVSLFAAQRAIEHAAVLTRKGFTDVANQLSRATGSIGANIAEGYSRRTGRDRARLLVYALGSAREAIHWYVSVASLIPPDEMQTQLDALDQVRRMLMSMIPKERTAEATKKADRTSC